LFYSSRYEEYDALVKINKFLKNRVVVI